MFRHKTSGTSPIMLWDGAKACLRGCIIHTTEKKRKKRHKAAKQKDLKDRIKDLEKQHKKSRASSILNDLKTSLRKLQDFYQKRMRVTFVWSNSTIMNKETEGADSWPSNLKTEALKCSSKLKLGNKSTVKQKEIAETFAEFYKVLYWDDSCCDENRITNYF